MCDFIAGTVEKAPARALELGCAEASFLIEAFGRFPDCRWTGVDVSAYALARSREVLPTAALCRCTVTELPFADASFDLVTAFDVLEHVPDLPAALKEIRRVIRHRGTLVASVPVYDGPMGVLVRALDRDPTHVHRRNRRWWLSERLNADFRLLRWHGVWRYYLGRYWHFRSQIFRCVSPAIVTAWEPR